MSASRYRPKRRLRSEILPLVVILSLPLAIFLAFPDGAVGFVPSESASRSKTVNAIVFLDAEREAKLLASARTSWQSDSASRRGVRANLLMCGFSDRNVRIASGLLPDVPSRIPQTTDFELNTVPHGVAADGPSLLTADPPAPKVPVFPKDELLKLN